MTAPTPSIVNWNAPNDRWSDFFSRRQNGIQRLDATKHAVPLGRSLLGKKINDLRNIRKGHLSTAQSEICESPRVCANLTAPGLMLL
jgi:hypothetical protein